MRKPVLLCMAVILFAAVIPAGCYDRREVDDMAHVAAIGFDRGVSERLRLTLQIVSFKGGAGGGGAAGGSSGGDGGGGDRELGMVGSTMVVTVDGPSFFTGLNLANAATARELNLNHAKLLIFSEELARSGEIDKVIAPLKRYREIRETMEFVVSRSKAEDFIKENKNLIGRDPAKSMELIRKQPEYTGFFPRVSLHNFYNNLKSNMQQPVAVLAGVNSLKNLKEAGPGEPPESVGGAGFLAGQMPRQGGPKRERFGVAVFNGAKMVGELTGQEARTLQMVTGDFRRGFFTIQDPLAPDRVVPLDVRPARSPRIGVSFEGKTPVIDVRIRLEGDVLAIQSGINYESPELKPVLEQAFEAEVKNGIDSLIARCQNEFKADIFGFGRSAVYHFPTIEEWERYRWLEKFPGARISTQVDFVIRRTGMMLKTSPAPSAGGGGE